MTKHSKTVKLVSRYRNILFLSRIKHSFFDLTESFRLTKPARVCQGAAIGQTLPRCNRVRAHAVKKIPKESLDGLKHSVYSERMAKFQIVDKSGSPYSVAFEASDESEATRTLRAYKGAMPRANGLRLINVDTGKEVAKRIR